VTVPGSTPPVSPAVPPESPETQKAAGPAALAAVRLAGSGGYQRIELPGGAMISGTDRRATAERIFDFDLTGRSVLDIGCHHGFYLVEAKRRGAGYVVGLEAKRRRLLVAKEVRRVFGYPDFHLVRGRFPGARLPRRVFDVVLLMNMLHHLETVARAREAILAARRLARERLILCLRPPMDEGGLGERLEVQEIWQVKIKPDGRRVEQRRALLSPGFARDVLAPHAREIECLPAPDYAGRFLIIAHL